MTFVWIPDKNYGGFHDDFLPTEPTIRNAGERSSFMSMVERGWLEKRCLSGCAAAASRFSCTTRAAVCASVSPSSSSECGR